MIKDRLVELADNEVAGVESWLAHFDRTTLAALLVEICRVLDYWTVRNVFARDSGSPLPRPDLDIMYRGWNSALAMLLPRLGRLSGFPLTESTTGAFQIAEAVLHTLGRAATLKQSSEMINYGMATADIRENDIVLRASDRCAIDHYLDRLERHRVKNIEYELDKHDPMEAFLDVSRPQEIQSKMEDLIFPWNTGRGVMIGYDADPEIDNYFIALVTKQVIAWRNEAGIHPESKIAGVSGADISAIVLLITSAYLKHIQFVGLGRNKVPDANYAMSLTIWKTMDEFAQSISDFTGLAVPDVLSVLNLITLKPNQCEHLEDKFTPFVPLLIQISDEYLLKPVSSILRNPFRGIHVLHAQDTTRNEISIREFRENWMMSDLYHLFLGNRYECVPGTSRLKRGGNVVTDIDAAVLDLVSGELALFQLKWQDFSSNDVRRWRSRAKNFVDRVDAWARKTDDWIREFGAEALCTSLRLVIPQGQRITAIRLFAIGRSAARFQSYGYAPNRKNVAACTWDQFIRVRHEIGPVDIVFSTLHREIQAEQDSPVDMRALPHEINVDGQKIVFENFWNVYDNQDQRND